MPTVHGRSVTTLFLYLLVAWGVAEAPETSSSACSKDGGLDQTAVEAALVRTFAAMDFEILADERRTNSGGGTTACVALQLGAALYVAHAGGHPSSPVVVLEAVVLAVRLARSCSADTRCVRYYRLHSLGVYTRLWMCFCYHDVLCCNYNCHDVMRFTWLRCKLQVTALQCWTGVARRRS